MAKVLLVEDDIGLTVMVSDAIKSLGHAVDVAHNSFDADSRLLHADYDLIVLDWQLPDGSGYDLCLKWRRRSINSSILFLTSRTEVEAIAGALNAGAEDYLTKPFDIRELLSRVRAVLRRQKVSEQHVLKVAGLELDSTACRAMANDAVLDLQRMEMELLEHFMRNPNKLFSVEQLQHGVWADNNRSSKRGVYASIGRLRKALGAAGLDSVIANEPGRGYGIKSKELEERNGG